jgi:glycosyltransferase involved in cell wall biosynthesis
MPTRLSIALCTYNGRAFLKEQLASILAQTRLPDEVIVVDDDSTDNTVELLEAFRSEAPFPVRIHVQPTNIGSTRNFETALRHCTGDLIALSDQDDVWSPSRLEASEDFLQHNPRAAFVFTDGQVIDEAGHLLNRTLWQSFHFDEQLQTQMASGDTSILVRHRFITGATITLRASLLSKVLPFPASWVHDEWLATITPFFAEIGMLPLPLLHYRVHSSQQVGAKRTRTNTAVAHWQNIQRLDTQMREIFAHLALHPPQRRFELLDAYRAHAQAIERRSNLPASRIARIPGVAVHLADYRRHAAGLGSAAKDLLLAKPLA